MTGNITFTSAQPLISLLHEDDPELLQSALTLLNENVGVYWAELSPYLSLLEELAESSEPYAKEASYCASRVYFYLGAHKDSLRLALNAPELLDISSVTAPETIKKDVTTDKDTDSSKKSGVIDEFKSSIIASSLDAYISFKHGEYRRQQHDSDAIEPERCFYEEALETAGNEDVINENFEDTIVYDIIDTKQQSTNSLSAAVSNIENENLDVSTTTTNLDTTPQNIDSRIVTIVLDIINAAVECGDYKEAIGLALSCYRLDLIKDIVLKAKQPSSTLEFLFSLAQNISLRSYQKSVYQLLIELYRTPVGASKSHAKAVDVDASTNSDSNKQHTLTSVALPDVSDFGYLTICYIKIGDYERLGEMIRTLLDSQNEADYLIALQCAFDVAEFQNLQFQDLLAKIIFPVSPSKPAIVETVTVAAPTVTTSTTSTATTATTTSTTSTTPPTVAEGNEEAEKEKETETDADADATIGTTSDSVADEKKSLLPKDGAKSSSASDSASESPHTPAESPNTPSTPNLLTPSVIVAKKADKATKANGETENGKSSRLNILSDKAGDTQEWREYNLSKVLDSTVTSAVHLNYLFNRSRYDTRVMSLLKSATENNSVTHQGALFSTHGLLTCGTSLDTFLRANITWMTDITSWGKYQAVSSLGLTHRGSKHIHSILSPYLHSRPTHIPAAASSSNEYELGGAYLALGLATSTYNRNEVEYLDKAVNEILAKSQSAILAGNGNGNGSSSDSKPPTTTSSSIILHGASLGLGVASICSGNLNIEGTLQNVVSLSDPIASEAAAQAIGLTLLGTGHSSSESCLNLLVTAHTSIHEKIRRGAAFGAALIYAGTAEQSLPLAHALLKSNDHVLRLGGVWALALGYAATGSSLAVASLLDISVDDSNEDVQRAAATGVGFVLASTPEKAPQALKLLANSHSIHHRYGAAMGIGIACSGLGLEIPSATDIISPLLSDGDDIVRQAAFLSMSLLLHNLVEPETEKEKENKEKEREKEREKEKEKEKTDASPTAFASAPSPTPVASKNKKTSPSKNLSTAKTKAEKEKEKDQEKEIGTVARFRSLVLTSMSRRAEASTRLGLIISSGILECGGRNSTISLLTQNGQCRIVAAAGLAIFSQFWHWHASVPFICLAMSPSCITGLDHRLNVVKPWKVAVGLPTHDISYPPLLKEQKASQTSKLRTSGSLSTKKIKKKSNTSLNRREGSDLASSLLRSYSNVGTGEKKDGDNEKEKEKEKGKDQGKTTVSALQDPLADEVSILNNPVRYLRSMKGKIVPGKPTVVRYVPIRDITKPTRFTSVVLLQDRNPEAENVSSDGISNKDNQNTDTSGGSKVVSTSIGVDEKEPPVPAAFALASLGLKPQDLGIMNDETTGVTEDDTTTTTTTTTTENNNNDGNNNNNNDNNNNDSSMTDKK